MKKYYLLIVMSFAALGVMAQTTLVATLTHAGVTTEYYGEKAFVTAVEASVDGDLITLSEGLFTGPTINKSLNIRGNGVGSTVITSEVTLDKSTDENEENHWLNIEGITFNADIKIQRPSSTDELYVVKNLCMKRCDISKFDFNDNAKYKSTLKNCSFINCRITNEIALYNVCEVSFINSIVRGYHYNIGLQETNPKVNMLNCVYIANNAPSGVSFFNAKNSVILINADYYRYYPFPTTVSFQNCVISGYINSHSGSVNDLFLNGIEHDKTIWMPMEEVFATLTDYSNYDATNDYQLKEITSEEVDGTLLGIYNGNVPYTSTVTYPHFTTFNVAEKAVDGKLSVEVATE